MGGENDGMSSRAPYFHGQNTLVAGLKASTLYGSNSLIASGSAGDGMVGGENSVNVMDAQKSFGNNYMEGHQGQYTPTAGFTGSFNVMLGGAGNDVMVAGAGINERVEPDPWNA